jgi:hypothetical protein
MTPKKKEINVATLIIGVKKFLGIPLDNDSPITNPRKFKKDRKIWK